MVYESFVQSQSGGLLKGHLGDLQGGSGAPDGGALWTKLGGVTVIAVKLLSLLLLIGCGGSPTPVPDAAPDLPFWTCSARRACAGEPEVNLSGISESAATAADAERALVNECEARACAGAIACEAHCCLRGTDC